MWTCTLIRQSPPCHLIQDDRGTKVIIRADPAGRYHNLRIFVREGFEAPRRLVYFIRVFGRVEDVYDHALNQLATGQVEYTKPIGLVFDLGGVIPHMYVPVPTPPNRMLN